MPLTSVKAPPYLANASEDENTGAFNHGEYATWFGNALVSASMGTLALIVTRQKRGVQRNIAIISDILLAAAVCIMIWASAKYFLIGRSRHHWTAYLFLIPLVAIIAAILWLCVEVTDGGPCS